MSNNYLYKWLVYYMTYQLVQKEKCKSLWPAKHTKLTDKLQNEFALNIIFILVVLS